MTARGLRLLLAVTSLSGCALPVVSAGTFLPAGDLKKGELQAGASMEVGRVLAGPRDVTPTNQSPQIQQWEVSTWIAADGSLRYAPADDVVLELQLKGTNPITPFVPELVGAAVGARVRLLDRKAERGLAVEVGGRLVGVLVDQQLQHTIQNGATPTVQIDEWSYRAFGLELPLVATWRLNEHFALTGSPFLRAYWIRVFHKVITDGSETVANRLDWTPVLSSGVGLAAALDFGQFEISPGVAVEAATRPGPGQPTQVLFEPGVSLGFKW